MRTMCASYGCSCCDGGLCLRRCQVRALWAAGLGAGQWAGRSGARRAGRGGASKPGHLRWPWANGRSWQAAATCMSCIGRLPQVPGCGPSQHLCTTLCRARPVQATFGGQETGSLAELLRVLVGWRVGDMDFDVLGSSMVRLCWTLAFYFGGGGVGMGSPSMTAARLAQL